jgi:hypothetical protein
MGAVDFHRRVHQVALVYRDRAGLCDPCNSAKPDLFPAGLSRP